MRRRSRLWRTPPFEPVVAGHDLFARGASDNKGQDFAHLKAVEAVLAQGKRTADLMQADGGTPVSTAEMGDAIVAALDASL